MLHVTQPLALLALGTLAVPILIHLRHRPLPVVRVGSLRPFRFHPSSRRARTPDQWPLLLVRCAVLATLTFALAGARWTPRNPPPARWCLRVPGTILQGTNLLAWEGRLRDGFTPRWLAPGFPRILNPGSPGTTDLDADLWSLFRQADGQVPAGSEARVFGPTWAAQFQGERPVLRHLRVHWHAIPMPPPDAPPTPAVRVGLVHGPDRAEDARYLRAAFQAIGVSVVAQDSPDWIVQLGLAPLPDRWTESVRRGTPLVRDAPESLAADEVDRRLTLRGQVVHLHRRVAAPPGVPRFRDSHGEPWLTVQSQGAAVTWQVAFRFHPEWTDWPLGTAFPDWWRDQLLPAPPHSSPVDPEQAAPRFEPPRPGEPPPSTTVAPDPIDLRSGCWLLALLLFLAERAWSAGFPGRPSRRRPESQPSTAPA